MENFDLYVYYSGEEGLDKAVSTVTGLFRQSLASIFNAGSKNKKAASSSFILSQKDKVTTPPSSIFNEVDSGAPRPSSSTSASIYNNLEDKEAASHSSSLAKVEPATSTPRDVGGGTSGANTNKQTNTAAGELDGVNGGLLEKESERRGTDVNVKFTFDDSFLKEETEVTNKTATSLTENGEDVKIAVLARGQRRGILSEGEDTTSVERGELASLLAAPRGNKLPVYFDPQVFHFNPLSFKTFPFFSGQHRRKAWQTRSNDLWK